MKPEQANSLSHIAPRSAKTLRAGGRAGARLLVLKPSLFRERPGRQQGKTNTDAAGTNPSGNTPGRSNLHLIPGRLLSPPKGRERGFPLDFQKAVPGTEIQGAGGCLHPQSPIGDPGGWALLPFPEDPRPPPSEREVSWGGDAPQQAPLEPGMPAQPRDHQAGGDRERDVETEGGTLPPFSTPSFSPHTCDEPPPSAGNYPRGWRRDLANKTAKCVSCGTYSLVGQTSTIETYSGRDGVVLRRGAGERLESRGWV